MSVESLSNCCSPVEFKVVVTIDCCSDAKHGVEVSSGAGGCCCPPGCCDDPGCCSPESATAE
jgi:hypothetical protein